MNNNKKNASTIFDKILEQRVKFNLSNFIQLSLISSQSFNNLKKIPLNLKEKLEKKSPFNIKKIEERLHMISKMKKKKLKEEKLRKDRELEASKKKKMENDSKNNDTFFKYF